MTRACVCDGYYTGVDCSFRQCPRGDDPLTTEIECQGVSSGAQSHEVQEITLTADKQLSGEMTLTYTDAYGQSWTTMPIEVGGDLEFDLRIAGSGSGGCSLKYMSATLTSEKFRESDAVSTDTDFDFGATEFGVPGVLAAAMNAVDCESLTAAQMQSLLELNSVVKNVKVTKSGDASSGTARFHVSIGDLNFQHENDGMEIGVFSMTARSDAEFHSAGDRSQAIKDALQALPYNVIPSVEVSRVKVDGGSDYADSTVVSGNMVQQKYRITFSDAANAGDQAMLQCNAEGCDADGCAPRYKGVTHKRYISTKYRADPMSTEGSGVTDYRTAIVATGQGSWWLRSHSLDVRTQSPFTSGTYHVHWDLGNGKVSSASFPYNADQATIQSALRTIEGWGGVTVSCHGASGFAGRKYDGIANANFGLECKITYAVGFEDGGKLPTITYDNIHQGMDAAIDGSGVSTHYTDLQAASVEIECQNEICILNDLGSTGDGDYTSRALFLGALGQRTGAAASCSSGIDCYTGKQDNFIGYVYIRHSDATKDFPVEGTYEIVRVGSGLRTDNVADLVIYAPGVPDIAAKSSAFGTTARLYKATPLMPMWPSYSNTIGLHDTSFRAVFAPIDNFRLGKKQDLTDAATTAATIGHFPTTGAFNLAYGRNGAKDYTGSPTANIQVATTCDTVLGILDGFTGNGPYPSLASADGTSICDCKRTAMEVSPFEVELTITCPGWLGYLLQSDTADDTAETTYYLESFKKYDHAAFVIPDNAVPANLHTTKVYNVFFGHRRLSPERSLEQLVAVGDMITITASGSNDNKQFKVKSFAYDNMWGDGNKGSAIWSGKSGYLGADTAAATGLRAAIELSASVDYASYGDFVPFLKVDPPPSDDYLVTELFTEGTNGTSFVRTLEDISTFRAEVATLKLYDTPSTTGAVKEGQTTASDNLKFDASQLSGSFQLIYDGVESPVIPVTASANQMMQYLSEMSSLAHVPVVKKYQDSTELSDDVEAVASLSASVKWQFTFDARYGDAKKLTFKFVDANTDERKTSNVLGSGGAALTNGVLTAAIPSSGSDKNLKAANNKIVMTYTSGSVFYDALDSDFDTTDSATDVSDHVLDDFFHDELAMDVVPGTKLKVSSAEVHHLYLYQMDVESAGTDVIAIEKGCTATAAEHSHVVIEYDGMFSSAKSLCATTDTFAALGSMATSISGDIPALKGISITIDAEEISGTYTSSITGATLRAPAAMKALFDAHFAWGAGHNGKARARWSFRLPIGVKGDTFKIHFQRGKANAGRHRFGASAALSLFKVFTYRERNNNGREFTVTKAYENKVSDLISVSRIASYVKPSGTTPNIIGGGSLAGVINTPASDGSNAWASAGCGGSVTNMIPGTYHNVETRASATTGTEETLGAGAVLMVVVNGAGEIAEVQVTSGGTGNYGVGQTVKFADTRISAAMAFGSSLTECEFVVGDMTSSKTMSSPLKSVASGVSTSDACVSITAGAGVCTDANAKFYNMPTDNAADPSSEESIRGMRLAVECVGSAGADLDTVTVTFGGLSTLAGEVRSTAVVAGADFGILAFSGAAQLGVTGECVNEFYYQFGFYSTNTPRWNRDNAQNNYDLGKTPKDQQVALYGMKNHMQYQYRYASATNADHSFYGLGRDTFTDLNAGMDSTMAGYSITDSDNDGFPQMTASVIAGENGQDADAGSDDALFEFMENAEKYAYIGKGYDKLTVTPMPDAMTSEKIIIEYTGPSAGCSVTEVDRGTHESSECSGRGNCDYASGTCICDAGYTLEACSEQTVLV